MVACMSPRPMTYVFMSSDTSMTNHPLSGHFGQNHTLELIHCKYTWAGICTYVKDYIKSCMACARAKTPCHRPYGMLKQLPVPVTTMSNSGSYPVTPVASQHYSSTPVAHSYSGHSHTDNPPLTTTLGLSLHPVLTTLRRQPCLDVSSPCTCYIPSLVSFSPDLVYFTQT